MKYILVVDEGTSHTRAILFNLQGDIVRVVEYELTQFFPNLGWVEHCPLEIWDKTKKAIQEVCAGVNPKDIIGCGITNQRETSMLWHKKTGMPLSNAIVWQDRRTQSICNELKYAQDEVYQKTGLKLDPYFSASKIKWLIDHHQLSSFKDIAFGTIDSYLIWCMTDGKIHATDITNASRTLLMNIHQAQWDDDLLNLFSIPREILPSIFSCDDDFGYLSGSVLGIPIPISGVIGDQQSALVGVGAMGSGQAKVTYGTGGFLMCNTGSHLSIEKTGLLATVAYRIQNEIHYALEGSIYDAGSSLSWLKNNIGLFDYYPESEKLAKSVDSSNGVYFLPTFSGLGAPYWLTSTGASFIGMSRSTTKAHLVRAVLESIAFQTKDILLVMKNAMHNGLIRLSIDGGIANNQWFIHYLSSILQIPIVVPDTFENTAKGVAWITGQSLNAVDEINTWQKHVMIGLQNKDIKAEKAYQGWLQTIENMMK